MPGWPCQGATQILGCTSQPLSEARSVDFANNFPQAQQPQSGLSGRCRCCRKRAELGFLSQVAPGLDTVLTVRNHRSPTCDDKALSYFNFPLRRCAARNFGCLNQHRRAMGNRDGPMMLVVVCLELVLELCRRLAIDKRVQPRESRRQTLQTDIEEKQDWN